MDDTLKLELQAIEKLQALDKMLEKLMDIDKSLAGINNALGKIDKLTPFIKLSAQINIAKSALGVFKTALGGVVGLLEKGFDFGKSIVSQAIQGQQFKQSTLFAFEKLFKSRAEAEKQYSRVFQIGGQTPGSAEGLIKATTKFASSRFSLPEIDTLQGLYADVQAFKGEDIAQNLVAAIGKIKGVGKLTGEALGFESLETIGREPIVLEIGKRLKLKGDPEAIKKQVEELIKKGKVNPNVAIGAIVGATKGLLGENKTGEYAKSLASTSIGGALSNLEEAIPNLFRTITLKSLPTVTKFVGNISDAFQDQGFRDAVTKSLDALFEPLSKISKEDITAGFKALTKVIDLAGDAIKAVFSYMVKIKNEGFGVVLIDALEGAATGLKAIFTYIGNILGKALSESFSITGNTSKADEAIKAFEDNRKKTQATVELTEEGLPKDIPYINPSPFNIVGLPSTSGSPSPPINITNNIEVAGDVDPSEIAQKTAEKTKQSVVTGYREARNAARSKGLSR
ncbi:MAG: hypothetical protein EKK57_11180 [Proteobacteria bacterium]|nr:MAG: hypothetical protein EKK57_11180 [Pseudomonadota bacterium]